MNFVKSSYEHLWQRKGIDGMYLQIEQAGRLCYKSKGTRYFAIPISIEDDAFVCTGTNIAASDIIDKFQERQEKINDRIIFGSRNKMSFIYLSLHDASVKYYPGEISEFEILNEDYALSMDDDNGDHVFESVTAKDFVFNVLKKNGHGAMLEHGTAYLDLPAYRLGKAIRYMLNKFSRVKFKDFKFKVTTNYRTLCEKYDEDLLKYFATDWSDFYKRHAVKFIMDRVGSQSVMRHRGEYGISFAQESTRFCNYNGDKFGKSITFVIPRWIYDVSKAVGAGFPNIEYLAEKDVNVKCFYKACKQAEENYRLMSSDFDKPKLRPEDARGILTLNIKTEFIMTAFLSDWKHFFSLRDDSHAHPDIQYIAHKLHEEWVF